MPGRPYLFQYAVALAKSHELSTAITRKELHSAGFEELSKPAAWEHFAANADTVVVATCVPLSPAKTYVHVLATSNSEASAKKWAATLIKKVKDSKMVLFD